MSGINFRDVVYAQEASEVTEFKMYGAKADGSYFEYNSFTDFGNKASQVTSLTVENPVGGIFPPYNGATRRSWFYFFSNMAFLDIINMDTSADYILFKSFAKMFSFCQSLTSIDVSNLYVSQVTTLENCFHGNSALTEIVGLSKWDTRNVINIAYVFMGLSNVTRLDVSNFNTANVSNMAYSFNGCTLITSLDLSSWDTSKCTTASSMGYMFYNTPNLLTVYCRMQEDADKLQQWGGAGAHTQFIVGKPPQMNLQLDPEEVSLGLLVAPISYTLEIWNRYGTEITCDIIRQGYTGISDGLGSTLTLNPDEKRTVNITVSMSGGFNLDAQLIFDIPQYGQRATHRIRGLRGLVIPFLPNKNMMETWSWKTEVLSDYNYNEDRLALRTVPRVSINSQYTLKQGTDATQLERLVYEAYNIKCVLPRFEMQATASVDNAHKTLYCDTRYGGWQTGMSGIAWVNAQLYEYFEVLDVTEDFITTKTEFSTEFSKCLIMPASSAHMQDSPTRQDGQGLWSRFELTFYVEDAPHWHIPEPEQEFEGVELCDMPLHISSGGGLTRTYVVPRVTMDNGLSKPFYAHARPVATQHYQVSISCDDIDEINFWRQFLLRRQGAIRPFWASSQRQDIQVLEPVSSGQDTLMVSGGSIGIDAPKDKSPRAMVKIVFADGTEIYRKISTYKTVDGKTELRFTQSIGVDANPEDFTRVSFLSQFRLGSDDVQWKWFKTWKAEVSFTVQELYV